VRSRRAVSVAPAKAGARKAACRLTHVLSDRSWPLTTRSMTTQLRYALVFWDERRSERPRLLFDKRLEENEAYDGLGEDRTAATRSDRVNSERGGRPYRHERVAAAAGGDRSPHPHRTALDQHLVGATDRSRDARSRDCPRAELARASKRAGLHQGVSRHRAVRPLGRFRISMVAATATLPEHALHDVHHPRRNPDPG
jgi:hypothetical protein